MYIDKKSSGFTIVEIIATIIIMGILFTIAVLSYGDWQQRIAVTDTRSALKAVHAAMESSRNFSTGYPIGVAGGSIPAPSYVQKAADKVTVTYAGGNATGYCANVVSTVRPSVVYYIKPLSTAASVTEPTAGSCVWP